MFDVRRYQRIGSTNDEAHRLAQLGAPHATVVHAEQQTAGRGRLGRPWFSPPGNLYLSVLLRYDIPPSRSPELGFVAALATVQAADRLLPRHTAAHLKWPNDVLVEGAKLAGILLEQADRAVIVGIGLNVLHAPANAPYRTTTVLASGGVATVEGARTILLARLAHLLAVWEADGFAPIRDDWLARGHAVGEHLRIVADDGIIEGAFVGLDSDGALLLHTVAGRQRIVAGEIASGAAPG
jgi:BirA family biotin operon repressor/biotin-[acetyl-CoA-carboxylase] ligase